MQSKVFQLIVDNTSGVLSRISGLFSRRGYNIESITAGTTADPKYTRITIVATGDDDILEQIEKQLRKLTDVRNIKELRPENSVYRELCMIKVETLDADQRVQIASIVEMFRAKIIDVADESLMMEIVGNTQKVEAFIKMMQGYNILEIARTGIAGLARGKEEVVYLP
ncbi:MAG: acetolactate synthase small subunit [Lachnospiraceae bacterium]|nr:acetolactate synthase small subunit [Lachnospiraceae bacterium]